MNFVQYRGFGYSNRFLTLCRGCALYPHYGALPPSNTLELVPQEPRNSYHRSGLGLLQRDRSTACLPYRITRHPILGSPVSSRHTCHPGKQPPRGKTATIVAKWPPSWQNLSLTGTGSISITRLSRLSPLTGPG